MTKIFLTGITGLVGSAFVTALLRERKDIEIVCLARPGIGQTGMERVQKIVADQCAFDGFPETAEEVLKHVSVVEGDVTTIDPVAVAAMPEMAGVNVIFHCAADVNLGKDPTGKTFNINYNGTKNMLELAKLLKVEAFHEVSTAYVAGKLAGRAMEDTPINSGFNNPYEESKYKAEIMVRESGIPFSIYRPAIVVGRLHDGRVRKPLAFYRILEFLVKLKKNNCAKSGINPLEWSDMPLRFDAIPSEHVYFVPIDYVQKAITKLFQLPVENRTYHLTGDSPVTTKMIDNAVCSFLRLKGVKIEKLGADETNNAEAKMMSRFLGDLLPYFSSDIVFDQSNIEKYLGKEAIAWEFGERGLRAMIKSFYKDFFPDVDWIQELVDDYPVEE